MLSISLDSPKDKQEKLAQKLRAMRVYYGFRRETLAQMSGVPEASIKRFELRGEISLRSLLRLAHALGALDDFDQLFSLPVAKSLDEIEKREGFAGTSVRKRGRK